MFYVPDGTILCGLYECSECGARFLSEVVRPMILCRNCGEVPDMEIGPDDPMPENYETAKLLQVLEGEETIAEYDMLLSLAVTGGDPDNWI